MNVSAIASRLVSNYRRPIEFVKSNRPVNILLYGRHLQPHEKPILDLFPPKVKIVYSGSSLEEFSHLTETQWNDVEVIVSITRKVVGLENILAKAKQVRWIHCTTAGINHLPVKEIKALNIPITNGKGAYSHSVAEFSLFACNYFAKNCARLMTAKKAKKWDQFEVEELRGHTMAIIGLGDIGFCTAKIAKAFGMKIIGIRRNLSLTQEEKLTIDEIYGPEDTAKVMGISDYIVAALPLTSKTTGMIDSTCIKAMQPHAVFINVGRGETVDEAALIEALQHNKIRGAGLDVFTVEPLPETSPFYDLENVLLTFHNSWKVKLAVKNTFSVFIRHLRKYMNGEDLDNVVNLDEGY
eukprot:g3270.t1